MNYKFIAIAAVSTDGVIGIDNKIPWYIPEDFKHFKKTTTGNVLLIGYNTYLTLPEKAFENRTYIVLSGNRELDVNKENVIFIDTMKNALNYISEKNYKTIYVAGGAMVYESLLLYCDDAIITWVNKTYPNGQIKFPIDILFNNFEVEEDDEWRTSITGLQYKIIKYKKMYL